MSLVSVIPLDSHSLDCPQSTALPFQYVKVGAGHRVEGFCGRPPQRRLNWAFQDKHNDFKLKQAPDMKRLIS